MKIEGWEKLLSDSIEDARGKPFAWGQHDCATWALDVRRALTGGPDLVTWRGGYTTALGSRRIMRKLGWQDMHALAHDLLGKPRQVLLMAQRGDVVLAGDDPALGVCIGAQAAFVAPEGLTFLPITDCQLAWEV